MPAVFAFAVVATRRELARFFPVHDDAADEVRHHRVIEQEDEDGLEKAGDGDATLEDAAPRDSIEVADLAGRVRLATSRQPSGSGASATGITAADISDSSTRQ